MLNLGFKPEKIFIFSKNALLPIFLTGAFFVYFFAISEFSENVYHTIHSLFVITAVLSLLIAAGFKTLSILTVVSVIYTGFIVITAERYMYGEDYIFSAGYNIWSLLFIPNMLIADILFQKPRNNKYWSWFYIFLFTETAFIEKLQNPNVDADSYYFYKHIGGVNYPALYISSVCLIVLLYRYIKNGKILGVGAFLSSVLVLAGMFVSDNTFAFNLFLWAAVAVCFTTMLSYLNHIRYKDEELNISGLKAFTYETEKKCPLKYSVSLLYIDDYERLQKRFGKSKMILLKKMFINRIRQVNESVLLYNYGDDALILVFPNKNAPESFDKAEDIRRALVKSIFVFNENNHLQLTVSQCISEKKRRDLDALAVLARAEENLQKACKFTRNITIKA